MIETHISALAEALTRIGVETPRVNAWGRHLAGC